MTTPTEQSAGTTAENFSAEQGAILNAAQSAITALETAMVTKDGDIRDYLREINHNLREYPELLYLLDPAQRSAIYRGLLQNSEIEVVKQKAKKAGKQNILDDGTSMLDLLGG